VRLRPLDGRDGECVARCAARLSRRSLLLRYLAPVHGVTPEMVGWVGALDGVVALAVGASDPGEGELVGLARCVRAAPGAETAELAVTVLDAWQGRGLGRVLVAELAERALAVGVTAFSGTLFVDNRPARALLASLGTPRVREWSGDVVELAVELR
jgi:GNAT superfamily N-acetyltransferase